MRTVRLRLLQSVALALLGLSACVSWGQAQPNPARDAAPKRPLTVADAIQTTRVMGSPSIWMRSAGGEFRSTPGDDVFVSPDGKRYAAILIRGDIPRNGNWFEVIAGGLNSLEAATHIETVARLFTTSLGSADGSDATKLTFAHFNPVRWLDGDRLAFFFSDGSAPIQLVAVNVRTRQVQHLTKHPTDVVNFAVGRDGALVYAAKVPHSAAKSQELLRRGFVVANTDAYGLLRGEVDGYGVLRRTWNTQQFVSTRAHPVPRKVATNSRGVDRWIPLTTTEFSPDGRYALIDGSPESLPRDSEKYTEEFFKAAIAEARHDPDGFAASQIRQLFVLDISKGTARPLWNAIQLGARAAWAPDSRSVLVGPTCLPPEQADAAGLAGRAVVEVDVATGRYRKLPIPAEVESRGIGQLAWDADGIVRIDDGTSRLAFRKTAEQWELVSMEASDSRSKSSAAIRIELRQDLNTPPRLFAVETATGRERLVRDLNPRLRTELALGRVEDVTWPDKEGRTWSGLLYYPVHYEKGRRFPLVIQTHGHAPPTAFSLYGTGPGELTLGLGPSYSVFAAQPLANRDIAVLQMEDKDPVGIPSTPREPEMYMAAYEAAIEHFASAGLVDSAKVGLVGYSRTGWHVDYTLTHSKFPYAAAISTDNFDGSYLQSLLLWTDEYTTDNGAPPFGEGLKVWLERAPGFNADKVHTPLRVQVESPGLETILAKWEMFARLRQLKKPVEFSVAPDIQHGSHGLQNPAQCLAVQEGAVDWFDFWLNGHEDPASGKAEQYRRWHELRSLQQDDRKKVAAVAH